MEFVALAVVLPAALRGLRPVLLLSAIKTCRPERWSKRVRDCGGFSWVDLPFGTNAYRSFATTAGQLRNAATVYIFSGTPGQ